jgi:hypothetical protein
MWDPASFLNEKEPLQLERLNDRTAASVFYSVGFSPGVFNRDNLAAPRR